MTSQDRNTASSTFYILAAHGGAGFHPPTSDSSLKCSLREAISTALTTFSSDTTTVSSNAPESSALDAATALIAALEDAPDFNAGYGSNLTFDGDVECDASLMSTEEEENSHSTAASGAGAAPSDRRTSSSSSSSSSSYSFGSVGAVRGVRNPVLLARRVLDGRRRRRRQQQQPEPGEDGMSMGITMMMGRVPPMMLVGEGASQFAREQGLRVVDRSEEEPEIMVSPRARREWRVWRERWDRCCRLEEGGGETTPGRKNDAVRREVGVGSALGLGSLSDTDADTDLGGGHEDEDEEVSVLTPRAGSEDADGGDGSYGDVETLRARQDTVGAVVLVGGAGDVHQQVAAGVSRCVVFPTFFLLFISVSSILHLILYFTTRAKTISCCPGRLQRWFVTQALWARWRGQSVRFDVVSHISTRARTHTLWLDARTRS